MQREDFGVARWASKVTAGQSQEAMFLSGLNRGERAAS